MKKLKNILFRKIENCRNENEVYIKNEIKTNILMGKIIFASTVIGVIYFVFAILGFFGEDTVLNYSISLLVLIIQATIIVVNVVTKGHLLYARYLLLASVVIAVCCFLSFFGSEIIIIVALPMFLAVRYYDVKFTRNIVLIALITATIGLTLYYFNGYVNFNIFYLENPGIIFDANVPIVILGVEKETYIYRLLVYDYLFDFLILFVLGSVAYSITKNGRKMIVEESRNAEKSARIDTEIALATEIQANMLSCNYPAFPNHLDIDLFAVNYPAREMGGDFYEYLEIDDDHVGIVIGDVSGKGIGAAFFMSIAKSALSFSLSEYKTTTPAEHLTGTNRFLYRNNQSALFVTCWLGIYEISTRKLTYASAGHNPPVLIRKGQEPIFLKGKAGLVLAGMDNIVYKDNVVELNKGDEILLYTDGVTEANDSSSNLFGEERLLKVVRNIRNLSCLDQVNSTIASLKTYMNGIEQFDDITLLAMKIKD